MFYENEHGLDHGTEIEKGPEDFRGDNGPAAEDAPLRMSPERRTERAEGPHPLGPVGPRPAPRPREGFGRVPYPQGPWEDRPPMEPFRGPGRFPPRPDGRGFPRRQPAFRPGFVPEEARRERYESLSTGERITFQIQALSRLLHRMPESRDGQRRIMEILMEKGSLSQRELAELCDIRSGSLSELVAKMELNGYIARCPDPRDRRTLDVSLTEAGMLAAQALRDRRQDLYEGISREDQEALLGALERLNRHFRDRLTPPVPMEEKTRV